MPALQDLDDRRSMGGTSAPRARWLPLLGPTSVDGLWLASGQYRNGILFAPAVAANHVSRQILGKGAAIAAFDPRRITPMTFALHPRLAADTAFVCRLAALPGAADE